jgi:hypothetical protein
MAHFVYERVDARLQAACVVISPLSMQGVRDCAGSEFLLPEEAGPDAERAQLREIGAFDCDDTATLFFVKYLAKLSEPSWKVFPCYLGPDRKVRRFARL